ncbi:NAD-dependent epimerase/dehydratase family protein [Candidatus Kaiserbacteria bacterium]|nr:NAD-dependent epimerase/dehydratase family protein [Candidatus Kaiserbacteria bacterium]
MTPKLILVTGGAGFVGTHLCKRLSAQGHRVISLDNYFAGSKENHVAGVEYREGHTKDIALHVPESPEIIFHLGEYSRVEQSLLEPDVVEDLNVVGTRGVVEYWRARKCKLVYAGSSTKFGDGGAARERTPYASTKAANSELVKKTGEDEHLPYAITYFYNVYGPGERAGVYGTVIEAFKQMYLHGSPITVTSPGTQLRNFTHVDDIVDGLILVGESGAGDEYGLGNEKSFSMLEVAKMFGGEVLMLPPRAGNRMQSGLDTSKSAALGWRTKRTLEAYIQEFVASRARGVAREKRVLVVSTTFYPVSGPAEDALMELMRSMPDVQFDIVTTSFTPDAKTAPSPLPNAQLYRVGRGRTSDKYLLPFLGFRIAYRLHRKHRYLFAWSLMASYAALAGVFLKYSTGLPLLITLADQRLDSVSPSVRFLLKHILSGADQVYGASPSQETHAATIAAGKELRHSIGEGDAFANQLRYSYSEILMQKSQTS